MVSRRLLTVFVLSWLPITAAQAQMRPNTQRGATMGGIAGAIAGGIIGDNNDEAGAGAVIGGALGALAGGAMGNARDREMQMAAAERNYRAQQQYQWTQQQSAAAVQQTVSTADVVSMTRSGLGDSVVINQIIERGVQRRLEVSDIIQLHQSGVSEAVITAMQRAPVGPPQAAPAQPAVQAPIYIERPVEFVPTYVVPGPRYYRPYHPHHRHHRSGWGFGFGF